MKIAPKGCGQPIFNNKGDFAHACGDHIPSDFDDGKIVQLVLCDDCWVKYQKKETKAQEFKRLLKESKISIDDLESKKDNDGIDGYDYNQGRVGYDA